VFRNFFLVFLGVALISLMGRTVSAQDTSELFSNGNQAYEKGNYDQAVKLYSQIIQRKTVNGYVYFNLANAYFKKGEIARAVLFYEKAKKILPRDKDIQQNLEYALERTKDKFEPGKTSILFSILKSIHDYLSLNEWTILVAVLFQSLCLIIIFRMLIRSSILRDLSFYSIVSITFLLIVSILFFSFNITSSQYTTRAVVMVKKAEIRSGPANSYTTLLNVHAGSRMQIVQERKDWFQVKFVTGYAGWIPKESVQII